MVTVPFFWCPWKERTPDVRDLGRRVRDKHERGLVERRMTLFGRVRGCTNTETSTEEIEDG